MLKHLKQGLTEDAIALKISEQFEIDADAVLPDVMQFVKTIETQELIEEDDIDPYEPLTRFLPNRTHRSVETKVYYLPQYTLTISSELVGLQIVLSELFQLPHLGLSGTKNLAIEVYEENGEYPIVFEGKTLDTGFTIQDTAVKCLREINGIIARDNILTIIFHASSVAKEGSGVLIPAIGGSGKTTLAAFLMHRGYLFLNDDAIPLLSKTGKLLPIPLSFSIKKGSWEVLDTYFPQLKNLRKFGRNDRQVKYLPPNQENVQIEPVPCRLIIVPDYNASQQESVVQSLSVVDLFAHIIRSGCIIERPISPTTLGIFIHWLENMPCYRISYSSLDDAERIISELLNKHNLH